MHARRQHLLTTVTTSLAWVPLMILYTVKPNQFGQWCVLIAGATLTDGLQLGAAIRHARDAARSEHLESGLVTRVEMHGADVIVPLAHYQTSQDTWTGATA
ncbi:hypothetical protein CIW53_16675 [Rhodanobacter sp. T12-5]|nr:hypothetical protein CIW53_16675 [Rhodanobacter sp. T12-5]